MLNINNFYKNILKKYSYNNNDTGSSEVQIILLSIKIENLKFHIQKNKKDYNCKRYFNILLSKRKKFLKYLKIKNIKNFNNIISDLNI